MSFHGTLIGSPSFVSAASGFGQALALDGTSQYVSIAPEMFVPATGTTWTIRARFKTSSSSGVQVIFGRTDVGFIGLNGGVPFANPTGPDFTAGLSGGGSVADNAWHEMELNVGTSSAALFVDGVQVASQAGAYGPRTDGLSWTIGAFDSPTGLAFHFAGVVDDAAVFAGVRHTSNYTPYTSPTPTSGGGLVALYDLDGTADDSAGFSSASLTITESAVDPHTTGITLHLTGASTVWDGATVFTVTGLSGTAKTAQAVLSGTSATVTITTGTSFGTLTVSDGANSDTVTVRDRKTVLVTVSGVDIMLIEPASYIGGPTGLIFYYHGYGETRTAWNDEARKSGIRDRMLADGHLLAGISAGSANWGNDAALAKYAIAHPYLLANWNVRGVILLPQSMGGGTGFRAVHDVATAARVRGLYAIYPATSPLAVFDDNNFFDAEILASWGAANRTELVAALSGKDPQQLSAAGFPSIRYRFHHSPADTVVSKSSNTDPMRAVLAATTTRENSLVTTEGEHGDASNFDPDHLSIFVTNCLNDTSGGGGGGSRSRQVL